ncbi:MULTISPECIES: DEAD/DEAH box helicase [unclassified Lentimonas]|uniref:DEAD/DEAH box helicase n=1 Tax=unclassified Lentimonas TaxID=2630993 RepID=UPI00132C86DF|nr:MULTISPECIES: ATP-binding protein [unclassified Lentimonas]CAA6677375.1 Unannotated [Lentimonas sp. CC4]CAA6686920.1 Unannotated [Lentimonas sp. CC6]CAA6690103.1 Unannotated [Lentimonas sp. CC19]CAA6690935.1 Unannotated [Lentimonas sp. CC10]CAA7070713.1 Unannotated [Lentimonas sp. CC11]
MKIALYLKALETQPRKFVSFLHEEDQGPTEFSGKARQEEMLMLRQFVTECLLKPFIFLIYRRWAYHTQQKSQFVLRPHPEALSGQFEHSRLALVCELDASNQLVVIGAEARSGDVVEHLERECLAQLVIPSSDPWASPITTDEAGLDFIQQLPEVGADIEKAIRSWTHYLDWRQKLAERKANELYTFKSSTVTARGSKVELTLEDPHVYEMIKNRLVGETIRLYTEDVREQLVADPNDESEDEEDRSRRTPPRAVFEGAFKSVRSVGNEQEATRGRGRYNLRRRGSPTGQPEMLRICIEAENEDGAQTYDARDIPDRGLLQAAMEGELAAIDVQRNGLRRLAEFQSQNPQLRSWLFDAKAALPCNGEPPAFEADTSPHPNEEQMDCVKQALALEDLLLLWGPPGTGKTTVIAEIASQYCRLDGRILISSQANLAVDQALERLPQLPHIRPARISSSKQNRKSTLVHENMRWWLRACANQVKVDAESETDPTWKALMNDWTTHLRENVKLQDLNEPTIRHYRKHANVIGATCSEAGKPDFYSSTEINPVFDLSIVDEVSKATPPELILPALLGKRTLLVGDHRQLPPVFRETTFPEAVENGEITEQEFDDFKEMVTTSYFNHLFESVDPSTRVALDQQYRMHPQIMAAVNQFYADQPLRPGTGHDKLSKLKQHNFHLASHSGEKWLKPGAHLVWIDSTHDLRGQAVENQRAGTSRFNEAEADLCVDLLRSLLPKTEDIGIISLYRAQILQIQKKLREENDSKLRRFLEAKGVNTVDQFQGSERDIIIVSLTRTDDHLSGEFIKDFRRINVAISRARKLLIVIGRKKTFDSGQVEVPAEEIGQSEVKPAYQAIREIAEQYGTFTTLQAVSSNRGERKKASPPKGNRRPQHKKHDKSKKNHKPRQNEQLSKHELNTLMSDFDQKFSNT